MKNGFELHGVDHLSPSQLNTWAACPALWMAEKLFGIRQPGSAAMRRGNAAEHGIEHGLRNPHCDIEECVNAALYHFDTNRSLASRTDDDWKQRDMIPPIVRRGVEELRKYGTPYFPDDARQQKVSVDLEGVPVPVVGFLDFQFPEHGIIVDLKTTDRKPPKISPEHARQGALYQKAQNNWQTRFMYVTPRDLVCYPLENGPAALAELREIALRMERFLRLSADKHELAALLVPRYGDFRWSPSMRARVVELFGF